MPLQLGTARSRRNSLLSAYTADLGHLISRRRAETALRAAAMESAMADRAKSEFLANMSHELRTPLNAIIGFADLIQRLDAGGQAAAKPREYASYVSRAGRHLLGIIGDILDISKIESGNFELNILPQVLREIIDASVGIVLPRIEEKRQGLAVRVPDGLPPVPADALRLKQILINLLSNASKFTGEGGRIFVVGAVSEGRTVTVAVSDTGCGMTAEEIEYALKPFTQVQSGYARQQGGTGLGLPIAKALVLQHGGRFHVDSSPGAGTTVAVTLPLDPARARGAKTGAAA